jgi:NAD+ synthase (glutamine-hydrolysing)
VIGPYELQDFHLYYVRASASALEGRVPRLARVADPDRGEWPPAFPEEKRSAYDLATIRRWLACSCRRFFEFSQFKRSALPNGPKVSRAARSRRAATGGRRRRDGATRGWPSSRRTSAPGAFGASPGNSRRSLDPPNLTQK